MAGVTGRAAGPGPGGDGRRSTSIASPRRDRAAWRLATAGPGRSIAKPRGTEQGVGTPRVVQANPGRPGCTPRARGATFPYEPRLATSEPPFATSEPPFATSEPPFATENTRAVRGGH